MHFGEEPGILLISGKNVTYDQDPRGLFYFTQVWQNIIFIWPWLEQCCCFDWRTLAQLLHRHLSRFYKKICWEGLKKIFKNIFFQFIKIGWKLETRDCSSCVQHCLWYCGYHVVERCLGWSWSLDRIWSSSGYLNIVTGSHVSQLQWNSEDSLVHAGDNDYMIESGRI